MKHTLLGLLLATVLCGTAVAQELQISGIVTTTAGAPLKGVTVQVRGTDNRTVTGDDGKYSLNGDPFLSLPGTPTPKLTLGSNG